MVRILIFYNQHPYFEFPKPYKRPNFFSENTPLLRKIIKSHKYSENIMTQAWESFLFADEIKKAISKIVKMLFYDYSPERIYSLYMFLETLVLPWSHWPFSQLYHPFYHPIHHIFTTYRTGV